MILRDILMLMGGAALLIEILYLLLTRPMLLFALFVFGVTYIVVGISSRTDAVTLLGVVTILIATVTLIVRTPRRDIWS